MIQAKRTSRILIAEEHPLFRRGLSVLLSGDAAFHLVGEASTAQDVLRLIRELRPDALILSVNLLRSPSGSPVASDSAMALGVAIRQAMPQLLTLVLAHEDNEENVAAALTCGARGIILKSAAPADLLAGLRKVAFQTGPASWPGILPDLEALASHTPLDVHSSILTAREQEVATLLAEGKTVRAVANELHLSMKTIEAHKLNLMRKLDIHDRATLVAYANRNGLVAYARRNGETSLVTQNC